MRQNFMNKNVKQLRMVVSYSLIGAVLFGVVTMGIKTQKLIHILLEQLQVLFLGLLFYKLFILNDQGVQMRNTLVYPVTDAEIIDCLTTIMNEISDKLLIGDMRPLLLREAINRIGLYPLPPTDTFSTKE